MTILNLVREPLRAAPVMIDRPRLPRRESDGRDTSVYEARWLLIPILGFFVAIALLRMLVAT